MLRQSYAHRINRVKAVLGGLTAHADKLAQWGITPEYVTKVNSQYDQACANEQRRNAIKSSAQLASAEQEQVMTELEGNCGMIKKIVRYQLPKEYWPEFGFREGEYSEKKKKKPTEPTEPTEPTGSTE